MLTECNYWAQDSRQEGEDMGAREDGKRGDIDPSAGGVNLVSRRQFFKLAGLAAAGISVSGGLGGILAACGSNETTTATAAAGATTTASAATGTTAAGATTTVSAGAGTAGVIKLGVLTDFSIPNEKNSLDVMKAVVAGDNSRGGWDVGGQKYKVELVPYDGKSDPATSRSAVERMMSQDKVNAVFGDFTTGGWAPATEAGKTVVVSLDPIPDLFKPEYKYTFQGAKVVCEVGPRLGYFPTYAGKTPKKVINLTDDSVAGNAIAGNLSATCASLGYPFQNISFPATTTDFSAVATKILAADGDVLTIGGVPAIAIPQLWTALQAASYTGTVFQPSVIAPVEYNALIPLTELEGLVGGVMPFDTDNPTPVALELKNDYIAMYGEWKDPTFDGIDYYYTYRAAVQKAASLDSDAVANVLGTGLEFENPHGKAKMVARPDVGVPGRTVCAVMEQMLCTISGGKVTKVATVPLEAAIKYCQAEWALEAKAMQGGGGAPGGAPPAGGAPGGTPPSS